MVADHYYSLLLGLYIASYYFIYSLYVYHYYLAPSIEQGKLWLLQNGLIKQPYILGDTPNTSHRSIGIRVNNVTNLFKLPKHAPFIEFQNK